MVDRIRQQFCIICRTGEGMRQVVGFGDRFTGRGTFGGKFGPHHCNQWGLYGVRVQQCRDAALFPITLGRLLTSSSECKPTSEFGNFARTIILPLFTFAFFYATLLEQMTLLTVVPSTVCDTSQ